MMMAQRVDGGVAETSEQRSWLHEALATGSVDAYIGKRRHARVSWNVPAILRVTLDHRARLLYVSTRNVSASGMAVVCRERISAMSMIQVCIGGEERCVAGRVMHCTQTLGGYLIGIEFENVAEAG
ncbi:MAG TPA: PilZ domain-containing protein [Phycisphaerae bacterium]|jgi:hypothetical protein